MLAMPLCPCCQRELGKRQIRRHLVLRQQEIQAYLDALDNDNQPDLDNGEGGYNQDDGDGQGGPAPNDNNPPPVEHIAALGEPDHAGPALDHAEPGPVPALPLAVAEPEPPLDDALPNWPDINLDALVALEDVEDNDEGKYAFIWTGCSLTSCSRHGAPAQLRYRRHELT